MTVRIIADSACDLTVAQAEELGVIRLPLYVRFQQQEYADGIDMDHAQFYQKLAECEELPTTSQLAPAVFADVFAQVTQAQDSAVVITLSGKLSGTYQSAMLAAQEYEEIYVVDSESVCIGQRLLVERAVELAKEGLDGNAIAQQLEKEKHDLRLCALLDTLTYLKKGGRIHAATALAGELLGVKPFVTVEQGEVKLSGKARGMKKGNRMINDYIAMHGEVDSTRPIALAYSGLSDQRLRDYLADSEDLWRDKSYSLTTVGCVIGTHAGPNAVAVAYFQKSE